MRRPLLLILIIIIGISFLYTNITSLDTTKDKDIIIIEGVVKQEIQKKKYNEYKIDKFLIRDYGKNKNIKVGQIIKVTGQFNSLDKMKYEDFDYGRYVKSTGYKGIIYIKSYKVIGNNIIYTNLENIKSYIRNTSRYLYKANSDFINSLFIGEKEQLSEEEKDMFSRTGTSHIIAISGLHTGIICSMIVFIIRNINKIYKLLVLSLVMFLYCVMVGLPPSIVRAMAFIVILYLSVFLDKKKDSISTLSMIGIFLVINNPYIIYNVSFQLSFLATLSIIYFYGYINNIINFKVISLTLAANILTLPIVYYNFGGIPMLSIISNVIIVPFIGVIMYMSIVSLLVFKISLYIAKIIAYINILIINTIYFLLEKLSSLDFAYIEIDNPKVFYVILYYIVVFLYMIYKELQVMKEQENELQGYY